MMADHFKKLVLKNWLSYRKGIFDFHPGVNMIIGPSDHGKSAAMDALFKVMNNRPMGDDFQSWWGGTTFIGLHLDNSIIKYKKDKQATYEIKNKKTKKVLEFKAFRATVPQEVTDLLRMNRKINVQKQLEKKAPIFLLSENPADVARHLNEVANLTKIDTSLDIGKKDLAADVKEGKQIDSLIKEKTKELKKFENLDDLKILVNHAEKLQDRADQCRKKRARIGVKLDRIRLKKNRLKKIRDRLKLKPLLVSAVSLSHEIKGIQGQTDSIQDALNELVTTQDGIQRIQERLKLKPMLKKCSNLSRVMVEYINQIAAIENALEEIKWKKEQIESTRKKLNAKKKKFKTTFPDICPLCNSKVKRNLL